jgi:hypothetical protein
MTKGHRAFSHFLDVTFRVRGRRRMQIIYCKRIPRYFQYQTAAQYLLTPRRTLQEKVDEQGVAASTRRGATRRGASRSCHTGRQEEIVHISGVIYSRLRAITFRRNFPFSLTAELPAQKTAIRATGTPFVYSLTRGCKINAPRKSIVLSQNKQ